MLKTLVKINAVNQLQNARYAAGMGVEFIGFSIDNNSPNFMDSTKLNELVQWLSGVKIVGELADNQLVISKNYQLDYLQTSNQNSIKELKKQAIPLIFEILTFSNLEEILMELKAEVSYFLIQLSDTITKTEFDLLKSLAKKFPLLIKGVQEKNVLQILEEIQPKGIALNDNENIDVLAAILELIELED